MHRKSELILTAVAAALLPACQALSRAPYTDPLDSGEASALILAPLPSGPERFDEQQRRNRQIDRLTQPGQAPVNPPQISAGAAVMTEFSVGLDEMEERHSYRSPAAEPIGYSFRPQEPH